MEVRARAPGKIILAGEHAVVHGSTAVAASIDLCTYIENFSIIHGYDGNSFQQHHINQDFEHSFVLTRGHKYRLQCYYSEPGVVSDIFNASRIGSLEEDVDIIVHHILGVIDSFVSRNEPKSHVNIPETKGDELEALVSDAARPFLGARTDRFINEVELFLASGLNIEAYDAVYMQRLGWSFPGVTSESSEGAHSGQTTVIPYLYIFDEG